MPVNEAFDDSSQTSDAKFKRRRGFTLNAEKLVDLYQQRGWSQQDFALKAGLDARTIAKVKRGGACDASTLQILASTLGVEPADLIMRDERPQSADTARSQLTESSSSITSSWEPSARILESWKVIDLRTHPNPNETPFGYVWERFRIQKTHEECGPLVFPYLTWGHGIECNVDGELCQWRQRKPEPGDLLHSDKCWELVVQPPTGPANMIFESGPHRLKFIDAFHGPNQQWWQTRIAFDVSSLIIQILFPAEHRCKKLEGSWAPPGQNRFIPSTDQQPFLLGDGSMASWHLVSPPVGAFYKFAWQW